MNALHILDIPLEGQGLDEILEQWEGTIQWISKSPYRIYHQRKNWFVAIKYFQSVDVKNIDEKDIYYQTTRSSGPGGQHVNKTESAVRAIHRLSGITVTASDQRSQLQNKKLATERLMIKLATWNIEQTMMKIKENWNNHNQLERGNPVKIIQRPLAR